MRKKEGEKRKYGIEEEEDRIGESEEGMEERENRGWRRGGTYVVLGIDVCSSVH